MNERLTKVAPRRVAGELEDGRLTVTLDDGTATLAVDTPERQPLGEHERVATLSIRGDDLTLSVDLTADDVDPLVDALADTVGYDDEEFGGVSSTDEFVFNCRDCGFVGDWLTSAGECPECGSRDVPTEPRAEQEAEH